MHLKVICQTFKIKYNWNTNEKIKMSVNIKEPSGFPNTVSHDFVQYNNHCYPIEDRWSQSDQLAKSLHHDAISIFDLSLHLMHINTDHWINVGKNLIKSSWKRNALYKKIFWNLQIKQLLHNT